MTVSIVGKTKPIFKKKQESQQQPRIQEIAWANSTVGDMEADGGTISEKATNSKKNQH